MNTVTSTERPRIVTDHTTAEIYTSILFPWFPFRSEEAMEFNLGGGSWRLRNGRRRVVNGEVFYFSRRARTEHVANCIIAETHRRSKYRPLLREPQTKGRGEPLGARSQTWSGFDSTRLGSARPVASFDSRRPKEPPGCIVRRATTFAWRHRGSPSCGDVDYMSAAGTGRTGEPSCNSFPLFFFFITPPSLAPWRARSHHCANRLDASRLDHVLTPLGSSACMWRLAGWLTGTA